MTKKTAHSTVSSLLIVAGLALLAAGAMSWFWPGSDQSSSSVARTEQAQSRSTTRVVDAGTPDAHQVTVTKTKPFTTKTAAEVPDQGRSEGITATLLLVGAALLLGGAFYPTLAAVRGDIAEDTLARLSATVGELDTRMATIEDASVEILEAMPSLENLATWSATTSGNGHSNSNGHDPAHEEAAPTADAAEGDPATADKSAAPATDAKK